MEPCPAHGLQLPARLQKAPALGAMCLGRCESPFPVVSCSLGCGKAWKCGPVVKERVPHQRLCMQPAWVCYLLTVGICCLSWWYCLMLGVLSCRNQIFKAI